MTASPPSPSPATPRKLGKRDGIRYAITWLHRRAGEMNDSNAKAILNSAAFSLGNEIREGHTPPIPDSDPRATSPASEDVERARAEERALRCASILLGPDKAKAKSSGHFVMRVADYIEAEVSAAKKQARAEERERCAQIVRGEVVYEHYRTWPGIVAGNRGNDSEITLWCDALADAIRAAPPQGRTGK